jgi:hypothetical protein
MSSKPTAELTAQLAAHVPRTPTDMHDDCATVSAPLTRTLRFDVDRARIRCMGLMHGTREPITFSHRM